jgi:mono/diheme cytochrome c family protein
MIGKLKQLLLFGAAILFITGLFLRGNTHHPMDSKPSNTVKYSNDSPGKRVYVKHCLTCHQKDGSGVSMMYPPIVNNPRVYGDKDRLIKIILEGQRGRIEVHGQYYNGVMPPFSSLSNKEIANLLSYMRQNFENDTSAVTVQEVKQVRKSLKKE